MAKGFQVIKFVMLDFDENWERTIPVSSYASILYTVRFAPRAKLAVALEAAGVVTTYRFELDALEEVLVVDQVVHVPARCTNQEPGNTIRCSQG